MNTRERIINAAIEVLSSDYSATTQKIADKAEVSRRTLVRHFESKQDLIRIVAIHIMTDYYNKVKSALNNSNQPKDRLQVLFYGCIDCGSQLGFLKALIDQSELGKDSDLFSDFSDLMTVFNNILEELKKDDIISPHITVGWAEYAFHGLAEGASMALRDGAVASRDIHKMAWNSFWKSIKKD